MRKITFTLLMLCVFGATAQETEKIARHEIKINALYTLIGIPEFGYEYILSKESSVGVDILFSSEDIDLKFAITPHYRFYFGRKPATGFFTEVFGMLNVSEIDSYYDYGSSYKNASETSTDFALGFAVGAKFLTNKGWTFEISAGLGRNLLNQGSNDFVPRGGLSIGKRF
ncbi:MAG: DUF3575 domain-containing protein [Flavobacteriaceae bacterium]|nr:DUF3575 domain-containing protein [Flavobacteriaceae bacterium]